MGRVIDVDYGELKKLSDKFYLESNEIKKIANEMNDMFNQAVSCWSGIDSKNFIKNSNKVINVLKKEAMYLEIWRDYLIRSSCKYGDNIDDGMSILRNLESSFDDIFKGA